MPDLTTPATYVGAAAFGPRTFTDKVATAARTAAMAIQGIEGIRTATPDADDATALKDAESATIKAFSDLLAAIWFEASEHNLTSGTDKPPESAEIASWITDNAPDIDPDLADGGASFARDSAIDLAWGK
jgi:hypothetical protein